MRYRKPKIVTNRLSEFRIEYGLNWMRRYPTLLDYKQETRFIGAVGLICLMFYLLVSSMDYEAALATEQIEKAAYMKAVLACVNQAHGSNEKVAYVFDNVIIGVECQNFGPAERRVM